MANAPATNQPATAQKTVTVTLKRTHTHRGVDHLPGARIDVRPEQAEWLARQGVIEPQTK